MELYHFISHYVQIKRYGWRRRGCGRIHFISHYVQIKRLMMKFLTVLLLRLYIPLRSDKTPSRMKAFRDGKNTLYPTTFR